MRLSERLEAAASEVFAREIRTKAAPDDSLWFVDATTSNLLLEAAALAKRYEDAPVGSLTVEGEHWVFYNGGEAGSVNRVLDKTIRLVEALP